VFNIDSNSENSDWTKRTWDLQCRNLQEYLDTFHVQLEDEASVIKAIKHLMKLPVYRAAPEELKRDIDAYLAAHPEIEGS